jgi:hypothetical protein
MVAENTKLVKVLNKFVTNFLKTQDLSPDVADALVNAWSEKTMQAKFKTTVKNGRLVHPKGVVSKFLFFCTDERPKIREEFPDMPLVKVTCELGKRWADFSKSTNPEDIKRMERYTELFNEDQERYKTEKQKIEPEKQKKVHVLDTPYKKFCAAEREKNKSITIVDLNAKWKIEKAKQAAVKST